MNVSEIFCGVFLICDSEYVVRTLFEMSGLREIRRRWLASCLMTGVIESRVGGEGFRVPAGKLYGRLVIDQGGQEVPVVITKVGRSVGMTERAMMLKV